MIMQLLPALIIPAIVGLFILLRYRHSRYGRMLGWFTFKPVIATPFWLVLISIPPLGLLPGAALTIVLVIRFKDLFKQLGKIGYLLLIVDAIRWINSGLILPYARSGLSFVVASITPAAFALLALILLHAPGAKADLVQSAAWQSRPRTSWTVGLIWVFATATTVPLGLWVGNKVGQSSPLDALATGAILGACFGLGQWLVLRKYLLRSQWWIGVTALGAAIGLFADHVLMTSDFYGRNLDSIARLLVYGVLAGMSIGTAQWIILRKYVRRSSAWIWVNTIGWVLAILTVAFVSTSEMMSLLIDGLIVGLCTALSLTRIMHAASQPASQPTATTPALFALDSLEPSRPSKSGVFSRLAVHKVLFPVMLVAGGLAVVLLCGILPTASRQGYFEKWQPLTRVPADTVEILSVGWNEVYVKTGSAAIFHCQSSPNPEYCAQVEKAPNPSRLQPCASSGPEYSPFTNRPQGITTCSEDIWLHFPGGKAVYAIDQDGNAWRWSYGDNLTGMLMSVWALLVVTGVIVVGAVVWHKAFAQRPVQPPTE